MSFNAKDMTQGGQIASMRIRMFSQIANIMLYCLFIFFWILVGLVLWVKISWQTFVNGCIYWWCTTLEGMRDLIRSQPVYEIQYYGKTFRMNAAQVLHDKYMIWCGEQLWSAFVLATVVALVICLITFFVVSWILGRQGKQQSENEVTGGRQLTDNPKDVARMLKKDGKDSDIRIGDLPIIRDSEIQNFCLHGTVGAGKSEVIRRLANYARQRGDMVVIYDRSGEFVKSYYDPSIDKILNPLDARCAAWDLWKECLTQPDFDNTANTLIPMGTKEDPFWQGSGRTIFAEAAYLMRNDPRGAEQLGLQGSVDKDVFTRLLEGRLPDGADLSRMQDGRPCDDGADCWPGVLCREIITPFLARRLFPDVLCLSSGCAGRSGAVTGVVSLAARG